MTYSEIGPETPLILVPPLVMPGAIVNMLCGNPRVGRLRAPSRASSLAVRCTSDGANVVFELREPACPDDD
jgi:hypothetical protein